MNFLYKLAPIMRLDAIDNLSSVMTEFNGKMKELGPLLAGAALIITLLCIIFAGEKRTAAYIKKAVIICICSAVIVNYANILPLFNELFTKIFPGG